MTILVAVSARVFFAINGFKQRCQVSHPFFNIANITHSSSTLRYPKKDQWGVAIPLWLRLDQNMIGYPDRWLQNTKAAVCPYLRLLRLLRFDIWHSADGLASDAIDADYSDETELI